MAKQPKQHVVGVRLSEPDRLRLDRICQATKKSKSEWVQEAIRFHMARYEKHAEKDKQEVLKTEVHKLRVTLFYLIKEVLGIGARNFYLTSTTLTDCLPMEVRALPDEETNKVMGESTAYAARYLESIDNEFSGLQ
jgi:hypothetical protein